MTVVMLFPGLLGFVTVRLKDQHIPLQVVEACEHKVDLSIRPEIKIIFSRLGNRLIARMAWIAAVVADTTEVVIETLGAEVPVNHTLQTEEITLEVILSMSTNKARVEMMNRMIELRVGVEAKESARRETKELSSKVTIQRQVRQGNARNHRHLQHRANQTMVVLNLVSFGNGFPLLNLYYFQNLMSLIFTVCYA
jgi:hypothetical protein